ncbi:MAG TPA: hypothetical protein VM818_18735 [Vicinamibacterales bacterium]|nr:hypothetical protein [Vicinamibacterales bacterium]
MVSIRYGHYIATYDENGWSSSHPGLAEMLNALRVPADVELHPDNRHVAVARNAIALLRAGEIIEVGAGQPVNAAV